LAFIIIVGILLSEPLNHAGDAQPAPLPYAGQNVRAAMASPGSQSTPPPISMQSTPTPAPQQQVPTQQEMNKPAGGIQIMVGGGETANVLTPQRRTTQLANPVQSDETGHGTVSIEPESHATPPAIRGRDPIMDVANQNGETLVPAGTRPDAASQNGTSIAKAGKQYEAVAGDSLSKIAQKFYGSSSKNYLTAIIAANPSLKGDPNRLMAGSTYVIPAVEGAKATTPQQTPTQAQTPPALPPKAVAKSNDAEHIYVVKSGDNLSAIAREQCGDSAALAVLKELNKDTLKGGDRIQIGMKLRLPSKPVASIN
jgi:nucleoid-associated protein YgaU